MAYKINRNDEYIVEPDGIASIRDIRRMLTSTGSPEFYELEPAEVIEVFLDEEDLPLNEDDKPDWSKYGYARVRMAISHETAGDYIDVAPLDSNIKQYPYPTEYVTVVNYFGKNYYTQKLNLLHSVNSNNFPGLSISYNPQANEIYKKNLPAIQDSTIREIDSEEGDITFNGRFGNTIRFGSNIKEIKTEDGVKEDTGQLKSPNIIIRAGQLLDAEKFGKGKIVEEYLKNYPNRPIKEDINLDGSSIWMTTNQVIPLEPSTIGRYDLHRPEKFEGKQIIINSDRLVFNTKLEDINFYSKRSVNIIAEDRIVLEGHGTSNPTFGVFIGGADVKAKARLQPILAGDQMMKLFKTLIDKLMAFSLKQSFAQSSFAGKLVYLGKMNDPAAELYGALSDLSTRMEEPKSRVAKVLLDQNIGKIISEE
jgi:hypothetical protein